MINKVGLERNGVSQETQAALKQAHRLLFREGLTMSNALTRIEAELPPLPAGRWRVALEDPRREWRVVQEGL